MQELRIRQCRLRVTRHGGWSWGNDRQRLIEMASEQLPALIAELLEQLSLANQDDVHIEKLSLRLRGGADILSSERVSAETSVTEQWRGSLVQQLREQIASESPSLLLTQADAQSGSVESSSLAGKAPSNVEQLLTLWRNQGSLTRHLQRFTLQALALWEQSWLSIRRRHAPQLEGPHAGLDNQADALLRILPSYGDGPKGVRQARLHLLAELDFHCAGNLSADEAETQLDLCLPLVSHASTTTDNEMREEAIARDEIAPVHTPRSKSNDRPYTPRFEKQSPLTPLYDVNDIDTHVASALPYLILGTLHHLGYLQAAYATLESGAALAQAHCLSSALAIKLLPTDMEMDLQARRHVITTFSLREQPPAPQAYAGFESAIGSALSAADACIYSGLLAGHPAGTPLLIHKRNPGWTLFDTQGMFPLAVVAGEEELKDLLEPYSNPIVMLPRDSLSQPLLETIAAAGGTFLTDAIPARGDPWIAVDRARRFHTRHERPVARSLIRRFDVCAAAAMTLLEGHLSARRLLPEHPLAGLDVSTELAACTGLADLAYLLWGDREASHPLLAFQRLHDLEARVRVDAERIRVSLALGQRYFDLRDKGVLRDLAGVLWFGGRTLVFNGL